MEDEVALPFTLDPLEEISVESSSNYETAYAYEEDYSKAGMKTDLFRLSQELTTNTTLATPIEIMRHFQQSHKTRDVYRKFGQIIYIRKYMEGLLVRTRQSRLLK